jgi:sphingomyelin synthase-related protein 1
MPSSVCDSTTHTREIAITEMSSVGNEKYETPEDRSKCSWHQMPSPPIDSSGLSEKTPVRLDRSVSAESLRDYDYSTYREAKPRSYDDSGKFTHPLVGAPILGVFYCKGAALCLCPCMPHQRKIRKKLVTRYSGGDLNLMGVKKDPLDCYHVNPEFSVRGWLTACWYDRRCQACLLTLLFAFVCVYWNCVMQVVAQYRADARLRGPIHISQYNTTSAKRLPDLGFDWTTKLEGVAANLPDHMLAFMAFITFARFVLTPMRLTIFRRFVFCLGCLFLFRGLTIIVTLLPNPFYACTRKGWINKEEGYGPSVFLSGLDVMFGQASTCADVLYSGHTLNMTLLALVWHQYNHVVPLMNGHCIPKSWRDAFRVYCCCGVHSTDRSRPAHVRVFSPSVRLTPTTILMWSLAVLEYYFIIATHFHYTVDVLVGFLFTIVTWSFYHHGVLQMVRELPRERIFLERCIAWLEGGAEDVAELKSDIERMTTEIIASRQHGPHTDSSPRQEAIIMVGSSLGSPLHN